MLEKCTKTYRSNILHIRIIFPVTMEPSHVHPRALVLRLEPPGGTLLVPDLLDVQLELGGHHRVV